MLENLNFVKFGKRKRLDFSKLPTVMEMPYLIEFQRSSYEGFLQRDAYPDKREDSGLQAVFNSIFPLSNMHETATLEFVKYMFSEPRYNVQECQERGMTYGLPLKAIFRLILKEETDKGVKKVKEIKEQEIFISELPMMTDKGTFIINGAERVIVSQLHRSPGAIFEDDEGKTHPSGKKIFSSRIIPYRGSWIDFEIDVNDILYVKIDRKRKFYVSTLLRALGYESKEKILKLFFEIEEVNFKTKEEKVLNRVLAKEVKDEVTGEIIGECCRKIDEKLYKKMQASNVKNIELLIINPEHENSVIPNTLFKDSILTKEEALCDIYRRLRPGHPPASESAKIFFENLFFNPKKYDLERVGRYKLNKRFKLNISLSDRTLKKEDIISVIKHLIALSNGIGEKDDIDHLGNRRARSAGELVENQFRIGLSRMERAIRERMSITDITEMMPATVINTKPLIATIKEFFGSSQLSQFMDQTNPLAELTHKRRLSALGPGGLNRDRAGFEVRDVHHSHYGRVCPIETPEGANIGLISSLSNYARVNEFGFVETPYREVINAVVTDRIKYLSADEEDEYVIAQANSRYDEKGRFVEKLISARYKGNFTLAAAEKVNYIDVSPKQLVSVATALIPFLEHDDANRALMGSNMQRQAVPLLVTEAPFVGTGMEYKAAYDSGLMVIAQQGGIVEYVDAEKIVIVTDEGEINTYKLTKYMRSNQDTCINQRPIVRKGEKITKNQVVADGPATEGGELALGRNVLVAFMPFEGYNFEDAIIISEKLVKEDVFTSIHIEEFVLEARDTKLGKEEITRDIPNVSEEALINLDEDGVVRIGAEVEPGDILVGKVTPKGETEITPEDKLLRAIFGEKAGDVRDASLRAASGVEGIVINVKIFSRKERESKVKDIEKRKKIEREIKALIEIIKKERREERRKTAKEYALAMKDEKDSKKKTVLREELKRKFIWIDKKAEDRIGNAEDEKKKNLIKLEKGDILPPGVIKLVKVYIARKRKVSVGDKMAGRHGNKGVLAKILPEEDMPFLADGTRVEIVLNPLGVPSRMNVGQILETHLGWAANAKKYFAMSPVFDGATESEIKDVLKDAGLPISGKASLYNGKTGEVFDEEITVGYIYMMKLAHLVDDKMHARSIGPYSLVTQQPLGGRAQFGGQRFGEMEVWALEAYGAAYTLQELLTLKSDDVSGRTRLYESIVKGKNTPEPGLPESFNVLIKELQCLGLDVETLNSGHSDKLKKEDR